MCIRDRDAYPLDTSLEAVLPQAAADDAYITASVFAGDQYAVTPVSYTHLDVYKRQVHDDVVDDGTDDGGRQLQCKVAEDLAEHNLTDDDRCQTDVYKRQAAGGCRSRPPP